jgi:hypothetical protein
VQTVSVFDAIKKFGVPDVMKVDTEGHEYEILKAIRDLPTKLLPNLVYVEVHFSILENRRLSTKFSSLLTALQMREYKLTWLDPSHLKIEKNAR